MPNVMAVFGDLTFDRSVERVELPCGDAHNLRLPSRVLGTVDHQGPVYGDAELAVALRSLLHDNALNQTWSYARPLLRVPAWIPSI